MKAMVRVPNPLFMESSIESQMQSTCPYKFKGCKWTFGSALEIQTHKIECKYRSEPCVGLKLNIWKYSIVSI